MILFAMLNSTTHSFGNVKTIPYFCSQKTETTIILCQI